MANHVEGDTRIPITGSDGKTHMIDPAKIDQFFSGRTGEPITDEQWDESQRRMREGFVPDGWVS